MRDASIFRAGLPGHLVTFDPVFDPQTAGPGGPGQAGVPAAIFHFGPQPPTPANPGVIAPVFQAQGTLSRHVPPALVSEPVFDNLQMCTKFLQGSVSAGHVLVDTRRCIRDYGARAVPACLGNLELAGIPWDTLVATSVISAWSAAGRMAWLRDVPRLMMASGTWPDERVYEAIIEECAEEDDLGIAIEVLDQMQAAAATLPWFRKRGMALDVGGALEGMLKLCLKNGRAEEAFHYLGEMERLAQARRTGREAGLVFHNAVLNLCAKAGRDDLVFAGFDHLVERYEPDAASFRALTLACARSGDAERCAWALESKLGAGFAASLDDFNVAIAALAREGRSQEADALLRRLRESHRPDDTTFCAMMSAYLQDKRYPEAVDLFEELQQSALQSQSGGTHAWPSRLAYNMAIEARFKAGLPAQAEALLGEMELAGHLDAGHLPDAGTFSHMIAGFESMKRRPEAARYLDMAIAAKVFSDSLGYDAETRCLDLRERSVLAAGIQGHHGEGFVLASIAVLLHDVLAARGTFDADSGIRIGSLDTPVGQALGRHLAERGIVLEPKKGEPGVFVRRSVAPRAAKGA